MQMEIDISSFPGRPVEQFDHYIGYKCYVFAPPYGIDAIKVLLEVSSKGKYTIYKYESDEISEKYCESYQDGLSDLRQRFQCDDLYLVDELESFAIYLEYWEDLSIIYIKSDYFHILNDFFNKTKTSSEEFFLGHLNRSEYNQDMVKKYLYLMSV